MYHQKLTAEFIYTYTIYTFESKAFLIYYDL